MGKTMAFKIVWSTQSLRDLESLTAYIAKDDPSVAERFGRSIIDKIANLPDYPKAGAPVPERNDPHIRQLIQSPFRIIYRINEEKKQADILRIWHAARGEPDIHN